MTALITALIIVAVLFLLGLVLAVRIVKQYEQGVLFRLGRVLGIRPPGFRMIIPFIDVLHRVSLRIITMPIQSQGIITRDNVSVDVSAVAYFRVVDAVKSVVAIENVFEERGVRIPLMISVTITDRSGRTLSGQTLDAFYVSIRHAQPFSVSINCALGARDMRPYIAELAAMSGDPHMAHELSKIGRTRAARDYYRTARALRDLPRPIKVPSPVAPPLADGRAARPAPARRSPMGEHFERRRLEDKAQAEAAPEVAIQVNQRFLELKDSPTR